MSQTVHISTFGIFFFQAEDGIRDDLVTGFRRVLFRSNDPQRPIPWELPAIPNGFYRVQATLDRAGAPVLTKVTSFVVMDPAPGISTGEFGWSVGSGPGELQLSELAEIASRSGVNWLKLPLWSTAESEQKSDLARSKMTLFLDQLDSHKISLVGMLTDPPPQLADK